MRWFWVVFAALVAAFVALNLASPDGEQHPPVNPRVYGASWFEVHPYLTALGAGAATLVVGSIVVIAVNAHRRG